jgi:hypothetical protein
MPYTIKSKPGDGFGSLGVLAGDAREALDVVKGMTERGIEEVEVFDDTGAACDPSELEHAASQAEACWRQRQSVA